MIPISKEQIAPLQSKVVTRDEFNFDNLFARPLYSMLSIQDIDSLYNIATSVRYAGNARKKYKAIDTIMHSRGFRKLSAGTNRVCYSYFEDPTIVVKVAADKTGIHDNPREFVNQTRLKPFCTKVFEVDPTGVVAVAERVKPIESREEYLTVANDVYEMLDMITGKYIMADIGSKYFMNIGVRKNFGAVLLDFPYLYETDGEKLVCKKPDPNSPTGVCGGLIDYDEGFNTLRCTKCGKVFRAIELGKYLKTDEIVRRTTKMSGLNVKVTYKGKVLSDTTNKPAEATVIKHQEEKKAEPIGNTMVVHVKTGSKEVVSRVDTSKEMPDIPQYNFRKMKAEKKDNHKKDFNKNKKNSSNTNKQNDKKFDLQQKKEDQREEKKPVIEPGVTTIEAPKAPTLEVKEDNTDYLIHNEDETKNLNKVISNLRAENEKLTKSFADVSNENAKLKKDIAKLEKEKAICSEELEKAKADLNAQEDKNVEITNELKETLDTIDILNNEKSDLVKQVEDLQAQINDMNNVTEEVEEEPQEEVTTETVEENENPDAYIFVDGVVKNIVDLANEIGEDLPDTIDDKPLDKNLDVIVIPNMDLDGNEDYVRDVEGAIMVIKNIINGEEDQPQKEQPVEVDEGPKVIR